MLPLQGLHAPQVLAAVPVVERLVLLRDPVLRLLHVPVEALHLVRRPQLELTLLGAVKVRILLFW